MWESPVEEFEGLSMSALGTDEAYLRVKSEGELNLTLFQLYLMMCSVINSILRKYNFCKKKFKWNCYSLSFYRFSWNLILDK